MSRFETLAVFIKALLKTPQGWHAVTKSYGFQLDALITYAYIMLSQTYDICTMLLVLRYGVVKVVGSTPT